jgi:hypothetical protein
MPAVAADSALESGLVRRYRQAWLFKLVVVLATLATAALTLLVLLVPLFAIDVSLERAVQSVQTPWLDSVASGLSWTGFPPQSNVLFGALIVALFLRGLRWEAAGTLFAAAGSAGLWFLIAPRSPRPKPGAGRRRDSLRQLSEWTRALDFTATFGFLAFVAWRAGHPRLCLMSLLPALLVAVSRVYLGEHWPTQDPTRG